MIHKLLLFLLLLCLRVVPVFAEDSDELFLFDDPLAVDETAEEDSLDDIDALFQDDMLEVAEEPAEDYAPEEDLLTSAGITWGGKIGGSIRSEWSWNELWTDAFDLGETGTESLQPSIAGDLFFDARPDADFRVFGKFKLNSDDPLGIDLNDALNTAVDTGQLPEGWTSEDTEDGDTIIRDENGNIVFTIAGGAETDEEDPQIGTPPAIALTVFELFSDFHIKDKVFFRFGKHTIQWGVGYFFSPADVLNLTTIDAEDPTADREGPVSLKIQYPFSIHNVYLYLITNLDTKPLEAAIAPKYEYVIGNTEFGFGAYYQQALAPRLISTFVSSIDDFDFFGEGVVSIGSDRVFVRESRKEVEDFVDPPEDLEIVLETFEMNDALFFQGTIGVRYFHEFSDNAGTMLAIGQYFFNGEGYPDSSLLDAAYFLQQNPDLNGLTIADEFAQPEEYEDPPALTIGDLLSWGRHYAAVTVGWNDIFNSNIGFSLLLIANLSDLSGIVTPVFTFSLFDTFMLSLNVRMTFGDNGDEFTNPGALFAGDTEGGTLAVSLNVSMGDGSF